MTPLYIVRVRLLLFSDAKACAHRLIAEHLFARHADPSRQQRLAHMVWVGQVEHRVAQEHHQLFVFPVEGAGQRIILGFGDNPFPCPLPKLRLRRPKLFAVATND